MITDLPGWAEMSDLDKGAVLLHLHKRDYEGDRYAVENYPARYFDDPRLTALDSKDASAHAAQFEDQAETLSPDEYERLYDAALNEPERRMLWAVRRAPDDRVFPVETREAAVKLLTFYWPQNSPDDDRSLYTLLTRDEPGGEWREVEYETVA